MSLPRRAFLGVKLAETPGGLVVTSVAPGSMAERAAIGVGDTLRAIDGAQVDTLDEARSAARLMTKDAQLRMGDREVVVPYVPFPVEGLEGHEVTLGHIVRPGAKLRTIVTRPRREGRHPALFVLRGIGNDSLDLGGLSSTPMTRFVHGLARAGLVTMRLDRRGVGDSEGQAGGFLEEVEDARAALRELARYDFVDPRRIALFGHSIGGMVAPCLATEGVARIVVYGTSARPWSICLAESAARQLNVTGEVKAYVARLHAILSGKSDEPLHGRDAAFHRELEGIALSRLWRDVAQPTKVLHGEHDIVVGLADSRAIVDACPSATLEQVAQLDHAFTLHATRALAVARLGRGDDDPTFLTRVAAHVLD